MKKSQIPQPSMERTSNELPANQEFLVKFQVGAANVAEKFQTAVVASIVEKNINTIKEATTGRAGDYTFFLTKSPFTKKAQETRSNGFLEVLAMAAKVVEEEEQVGASTSQAQNK